MREDRARPRRGAGACTRALLLLLGVAAIAAGPALAVPAIRQWVLGGGGLGGGGGDFSVRSVLGQTVAGRATGALHQIRSGFWEQHASTSGITPESLPGAPVAYQLYPSAPNPLQAQAVIAFDVPENGGRMRLDIYDVDGRLVRTLADREEAPGHKALTWNTTDDTGQPVSSGIYFAVINAPGKQLTEKLVVVR